MFVVGLFCCRQRYWTFLAKKDAEFWCTDLIVVVLFKLLSNTSSIICLHTTRNHFIFGHVADCKEKYCLFQAITSSDNGWKMTKWERQQQQRADGERYQSTTDPNDSTQYSALHFSYFFRIFLSAAPFHVHKSSARTCIQSSFVHFNCIITLPLALIV